MCVAYYLHLEQLDVKIDFLWRTNIFHLEGFIEQEDTNCWYKKIDTIIISGLGYNKPSLDHCTYLFQWV